METKGTKSANYMTFINANVLSNFVSLQCLSSLLNALLQNTMAEQNVPAQPSTRTDEQIFLENDVNNEKTGVYSCQVDEQWFDLSTDLLRKALAITPVIPAHPFELPPSGDTLIDFVNELGYPEPVEIVSSIRTNYVADMGRVYSRDPEIFLTQSKPQSQSKEPKEESNSSPHPLWTFQRIIYYWQVSLVEVLDARNSTIPQINEAIHNLLLPKYLKNGVAENNEENPSRRQACNLQHSGKLLFQLVDEEDEAQQESIPQREDDDPDLDLAKKLSLVAHQEKGEEEGNDADLERAIKLSLDLTFLPQGRAPVGGVTIRDPMSETTSKLHETVGKGKAVVSEEQVHFP
ncbi:hypothetical protein Tco_0155608 [Tanacetum coccineum]